MNTKEKWLKIAQRGELEWQLKHSDTRISNNFFDSINKLMTYMWYDKNSFQNKNVLDLGCGPRLRTKYFNNVRIYAIDPLADKYKAHPAYDLNEAIKIYSQPAEEFIPELWNKIDFVFCLNVLDHCYDVKKILENCSKYLKDKESIMLLSVDMHKEVNDLHPISLNKLDLESWFEEFNLVVKRYIEGLPMIARENWGTGVANTWELRKDET